MAYQITVYDWSLDTTSLSQTGLETSAHGNDPGQTGANPCGSGLPTWTGVDSTCNGTGSDGILLAIDDDDANFNDGYAAARKHAPSVCANTPRLGGDQDDWNNWSSSAVMFTDWPPAKFGL